MAIVQALLPNLPPLTSHQVYHADFREIVTHWNNG